MNRKERQTSSIILVEAKVGIQYKQEQFKDRIKVGNKQRNIGNKFKCEMRSFFDNGDCFFALQTFDKSLENCLKSI